MWCIMTKSVIVLCQHCNCHIDNRPRWNEKEAKAFLFVITLFHFWLFSVFTALHCMQASCSWSSCRPSVRPSVRHTRVLWENERKFRQPSYTLWKENSSTFRTQRMVGGRHPLLPEILGQTDPPASKCVKNGDFQSIFACSGSAIILNEKSSIMTNGK